MKLKRSKVGQFVPIKVDNGVYYGGFQNSLADMGVSKFYRDRSCVVTAFTNTFLYMYYPDQSFSLDDYNDYHYDFYKKLRPHINGVPTVKSLNYRVNRIRQDRNLLLDGHILTENLLKTVDLNEKIDFINEGLSKDLPVIFINWMSRDIKVMSHHGVTITECNDMGNYHELVISSWGNLYRVNLNDFDKQFRSYCGLIYFERRDYGLYQS